MHTHLSHTLDLLSIHRIILREEEEDDAEDGEQSRFFSNTAGRSQAVSDFSARSKFNRLDFPFCNEFLQDK